MSLNTAACEPAGQSWPLVEAPDLREPAGRDAFSLSLPLRHAGTRRVTLRYEWQGPEDAPLLLVAGGISAGRHVGASARYPEPGWWPQQAGEGRALDTGRFRLLAIDWLGADGSLDVPIDSADQADAIAAVLARIESGK
jgi:homoserine O-acetyltransferase